MGQFDDFADIESIFAKKLFPTQKLEELKKLANLKHTSIWTTKPASVATVELRVAIRNNDFKTIKKLAKDVKQRKVDAQKLKPALPVRKK